MIRSGRRNEKKKKNKKKKKNSTHLALTLISAIFELFLLSLGQ